MNSNDKSSVELIEQLSHLKGEMNRARTDYKIANEKEFKITPYWVLGFVEGEGSFFIRNNIYYTLGFSLGQSAVDLALMEELRKFLAEVLPKKYVGSVYPKAVSLVKVRSKSDSVSSISISIGNNDYIKNVLIPFFDSMTWQSKKLLDYQDWKTVFKIRELGLHTTESGISVINLIISQMNLRRLTTNTDNCSATVDREVLARSVNELLNSQNLN